MYISTSLQGCSPKTFHPGMQAFRGSGKVPAYKKETVCRTIFFTFLPIIPLSLNDNCSNKKCIGGKNVNLASFHQIGVFRSLKKK